MSEKPAKARNTPSPPAEPRSSEAGSVYGSRWGPGPTSSGNNTAGSIAEDPASAPRRPVDGGSTERPQGAGAAGSLRDDEAAARERRLQRWEGEGGAISSSRQQPSEPETK